MDHRVGRRHIYIYMYIYVYITWLPALQYSPTNILCVHGAVSPQAENEVRHHRNRASETTVRFCRRPLTTFAPASSLVIVWTLWLVCKFRTTTFRNQADVVHCRLFLVFQDPCSAHHSITGDAVVLLWSSLAVRQAAVECRPCNASLAQSTLTLSPASARPGSLYGEGGNFTN